MKEKDLINFEDNIAKLFNEAKIKAPIHLYSGNEKFLINFPNSIYQENILKRLNYLIKEKMES